MAGAFIEVKIDNQEVSNLLEMVSSRGRKMKPALAMIGEIVVKSVRENFIAQGRPEKWKPLALATQLAGLGGMSAYKKRRSWVRSDMVGIRAWDLKKGAQKRLANRRILIGFGMHGGLMGSIHYAADDTSVQIGTDKVYGAIHQFGGPAGRKSRRVYRTMSSGYRADLGRTKASARAIIPARPYLMVQAEDWPNINRVLMDYLFPK